MKIEFQDQVYDLDLYSITTKQSIAITEFVGLPMVKILNQFDDIQEDTPELIRSISAIYWLMLTQAGERLPIEDADPPLLPFLEAFFTAMKPLIKASPEEGAADPTSPPVTSPSPARSTPKAGTNSGAVMLTPTGS